MLCFKIYRCSIDNLLSNRRHRNFVAPARPAADDPAVRAPKRRAARRHQPHEAVLGGAARAKAGLQRNLRDLQETQHGQVGAPHGAIINPLVPEFCSPLLSEI